MKQIITLSLCLIMGISSWNTNAQRKKNKAPKTTEQAIPLEGFRFRNIGPAFLSGRIADIVFHPDNENVWYVAVGSGGVWKTENAGTTWTPLFDQQSSYSTGCITLDPQNPATVWVVREKMLADATWPMAMAYTALPMEEKAGKIVA